MNRKLLSMETLETRETPAALAGTDLVAASLSAVPSIDYTGPLGGTVTSSKIIQGTTITQELSYVGPQGNTVLTETATITVNPRTGAVTGTITVIGGNGQMSTGTITGVASDNSLTSTTTWTGPNGNAVTRSGVASYDATDGTIQIAGTLTGPNGRSLEYGRTLGSRL